MYYFCYVVIYKYIRIVCCPLYSFHVFNLILYLSKINKKIKKNTNAISINEYSCYFSLYNAYFQLISLKIKIIYLLLMFQ